MAIDIRNAVFSARYVTPATLGFEVQEIGQLLVYGPETPDGRPSVKPCEGVEGEVIAGFAMSVTVNRVSTSAFETVVIPSVAPHAVMLQHNNLIGVAPEVEIQVRDPDRNFSLKQARLGELASDAKFAIDPATGMLVVSPRYAGRTLTVGYRYNMQVGLARDQGKSFTPTTGGTVLNLVEHGSGHGTIATSFFDPAISWWTITPPYDLRTAEGGRITSGGSGSPVKASITQAPDGGGGWLGLRFAF